MMAILKRWTTGFVSRVDTITEKIENQEALVDSAIVDMSRRVARARVQLGRVKRDGETLARQCHEAASEALRWQDRARTEPDRHRALECLRRSKRLAGNHGELQERLSGHEQTEQRLRRDIGMIEQKLEQLRGQRNTMRTRQTRAEALALLQSEGSGDYVDLEQILERWDERITQAEIMAGCSNELADPLAEQYDALEDEDALEAELDQLRKEER